MTFYAVIGYRKKSWGRTKDTHMVWRGTMSLSNPQVQSIAFSGGNLRDYDPLPGTYWISERVQLGIVAFFRRYAADIRRS